MGEKHKTDAEVLGVKSLTEQLSDAMGKGDMREVIKVAKMLADDERTKEKALAEANSGKIIELNTRVMGALEKVANDYMEKITELVGWDNAGIAFKIVPCDKLIQCKISMKAQRATGGGGTRVASGLAGVKELLTQFGDETVAKDYLGGKFTDMTWAQAYESNTDKNFRYAVLKGLRKLAGLV